MMRVVEDVPLLLSVAGSDPTGGAGLEADLRVFAELGADGAALATALTTQDSARVHAVEELDATGFARRLDVLLDDLEFSAAKIGMLGSAGVAEVLAARIEAGRLPTLVVVDPILVSSSGASLLDRAGEEILVERILPGATLATPNRREAARLCGMGADSSPSSLARAFGERTGARAVLVTGGDAEEREAADVLFVAGEIVEYRGPRIEGPSPHGTGCALSAILALRLAQGLGIREAVASARSCVLDRIRRARVRGRAPFARPRLARGAKHV